MIAHCLKVSSDLFLLPTACEWDCTSVKYSLITFLPTVCEWCAHFVKHSFITSSLWPTAGEWHCTLCEMQSHDSTASFPTTNSQWVGLHILWNTMISFYNQQQVSEIAHSVKGNFISLFHDQTECKWQCIFCETVLSGFFIHMINSEWDCTFYERWSHHIFSYEQQDVSELHILWKTNLSYLFLMIIGSEWDCTFCEMQSLHIFPMTNSLWVRLHISWKAMLSYLSIWPTASEWDCIFCERQSHQIFSYNQQQVSVIAHVVKGSIIRSFPITNR